MRDVNRARHGEFRVAVGSRVPRHVHLRRLPAVFVSILPDYADYDYVVVDDDFVIVEPDTYAIVDVIPANAAEQTALSGSLHFTASERALIRRAALSERSTEGAAGDVDIAVGSLVPGSVTLLAFPDEVYAEIPQLRGLRFVVLRDEVLLVNPDDRRVVYIVA